MTKLMQCLTAFLLFLSIWLPVLMGMTTVPVDKDPTLRLHITLIPFYLLMVFGLVSAMIVFYRVLTFNNCESAYEELRREISDAKQDLQQKGFKF